MLQRDTQDPETGADRDDHPGRAGPPNSMMPTKAGGQPDHPFRRRTIRKGRAADGVGALTGRQSGQTPRKPAASHSKAGEPEHSRGDFPRDLTPRRLRGAERSQGPGGPATPNELQSRASHEPQAP